MNHKFITWKLLLLLLSVIFISRNHIILLRADFCCYNLNILHSFMQPSKIISWLFFPYPHFLFLAFKTLASGREWCNHHGNCFITQNFMFFFLYSVSCPCSCRLSDLCPGLFFSSFIRYPALFVSGDDSPMLTFGPLDDYRMCPFVKSMHIKGLYLHMHLEWIGEP